MPYSLKGNCVVRADTGETVKCHPTRAQARRHLIALKINVEGKEAKLSAITRLVAKVTGSDRARKRVEGGASSRERMGMGPSPGQPTGTASPALVALAKKVWVEPHKSVTKTGEVYDVKGHWRNVKPGEVGVEVGQWKPNLGHRAVTKDTPIETSGPKPGDKMSVDVGGGTHRSGKIISITGDGRYTVELDPIAAFGERERRIVERRKLSELKPATTEPDKERVAEIEHAGAQAGKAAREGDWSRVNHWKRSAPKPSDPLYKVFNEAYKRAYGTPHR